jgi:asparagine synthase (glutamine-hydrolysing)
MCAIAGIFAYAPSAPQPRLEELRATRDAMAARGPDGFGEWKSGGGVVLLGHRRLSILDLSDRASQPMRSADGRLTITFNGEIYNYPALRQRLEQGGVQFRTTSDTEALLHLYAAQGAAMLSALEGMFAFAIWDDQDKTLFLARDPYGIKPLYYADDGATFRFASQVKALLAGAVDTKPDDAGLAGFCLFGSVPEPFTLYRNISALPAGASLTIRQGGAKATPAIYASTTEALTDGAQPPWSAEPRTLLNEALRESVARHLLSDVEVGLFLSAGIDSGALLGLMRDAGAKRVRALTLSFDEFSGEHQDETPLAKVVADYYGAEHVTRRVTRAEFDEDLPNIFAAMDQPSIDGINTWFVAKAAHEAGLKVALSGAGGDELLGGYSSFTDIPRMVRQLGWLAAVPGLGRLVRGAATALAPAYAAAHPKMVSLLDYSGGYASAYLLRRGLFLPQELPALLGRDRAEAGLNRLTPRSLIRRTLRPDPHNPALRVAAMETSLYLRNQLLRDADWAGMAHSVEIRTPLVDFALLKRAAPALPRLGGGGKIALAHAPARPLPDIVLHRRKTGFGVPLNAWTNGDGAASGLTSRRWALRVLREFGLGDVKY